MVPKTGPNILVARKQGSAAVLKRVAGLGKLAAYVGIPAASTRTRSEQLLGMAAATKGKTKKTKLQKAAESDVTNAELLFLFSKGSPIRKQPARPVLEPAVAADGNREPIAREIAASCKASIAGDHDMAVKKMKRAALAGQNAARKWFTDSRNGWKPLADSTKQGRLKNMTKGQTAKATGEDGELLDSAFTAGVDTGAMRAAIVGVVAEE